jgi:hypothetical protein
MRHAVSGNCCVCIGYALAQEFVGKTDKGTRSFNYSNVLGALTAGGISNAYYPSADRGFSP